MPLTRQHRTRVALAATITAASLVSAMAVVTNPAIGQEPGPGARKSVSLPGTNTGAAYKGRFYHLNNGRGGCELWSTNGTQKGSRREADLRSGKRGSFPHELTTFKGELFFTATTPKTGSELWAHGRTERRGKRTVRVTRLVKDISRGAAGTQISNLTAVGGQLWFAARGPGTKGKAELWRSNGTARGTRRVLSLGADWGGSWASYRGRLYLGLTRAGLGNELWRTNAAGDGVELIADIEPTYGTGPSDLTVMGQRLYFVAYTEDEGNQIWSTDGTTAGTVEVTFRDQNGGVFDPTSLEAFDGHLYFSAYSSGHGSEVWRTDGSTDGTEEFVDLMPGTANSSPRWLLAGADRLYFSAWTPDVGHELWSTDGTVAGTVLTKDIYPGSNSSIVVPIATVGSRLYMIAGSTTGGRQVWRSDGTPASTTIAFMPNGHPLIPDGPADCLS